MQAEVAFLLERVSLCFCRASLGKFISRKICRASLGKFISRMSTVYGLVWLGSRSSGAEGFCKSTPLEKGKQGAPNN